MFITFYPQAAGGGGGGLDRLAPAILVGNVPAGDSAVAYALDGFRYEPDTGNGAGLATAINALAGASGGVVYLRRGTYDLRAVGAPAAPFDLSTDVSVVGEGVGATFITGKAQGVQNVFLCGGSNEIRGLTIQQVAPTGAGVGGQRGLIQVLDGAPGTVRLTDLQLDMNVDAAGSTLDSAVAVSGAFHNQVALTRVRATNATARLGTEANWTRFLHVDGGSILMVTVTDCYAGAFDAGIVLGTASVVDVSGFTCFGFAARCMHSLSANAQCRLRASNVYGTANDVEAIGFDLYSHRDANAQLTNCSLISFEATEPAARVRSAANAGRAQFSNCHFIWPHDGAAVLELGTSGAVTACDRNLVVGCSFRNTDATGTSVEIFNAASTSNLVTNCSLDDASGLGVADAGTLSQIASNV